MNEQKPIPVEPTEAMQQALEVLEHGLQFASVTAACKILRAALAAAPKVEQEPVAWMVEAESGKAVNHLTTSKIVVDAIVECGRAKSVTPLYTAPPDTEALRAQLAQAEARVAELGRDAARYRWLRHLFALEGEQS